MSEYGMPEFQTLDHWDGISNIKIFTEHGENYGMP